MKSRILFGCSLLFFCILGIAVLAGCAVRDGGYTLVSTDAEAVSYTHLTLPTTERG